MRFAAYLLIIGSLFTASPALAASIDRWESVTGVAASFDDGTIKPRIVNVHPFVAPNLTEYRQSDVVTRRLANYRAASQHCQVFKRKTGTPLEVCMAEWNGF